jgi:hypothetical protein
MLHEHRRKSLRFGDFVREARLHERIVSFNALTPKPQVDEAGNELPYRAPPIRPRAVDVGRLLGPYVGTRVVDQLRAVLPLVAYLVLFQIVVLRQMVQDAGTVAVGVAAVILGLMLFMEGLRLGLMPFAETIGDQLPKKLGLSFVLAIAFVLGIGVTLAEPAIGALQAVGSIVDVERAPYLYGLLNIWTSQLVLAVGIGVGLAAVAGTVRLLFNWSLKPFIYGSLVPALALTAFCAFDERLVYIVGLAWDCGGVTTGPVTVPLVLALGIGIASSEGKGDSALSGFGIVTLASLLPVLTVLLLGLWVVTSHSPAEVLALAKAQTAVTAAEVPWYLQTPTAEIKAAGQAIIPLVLFLLLILKGLLRQKLKDRGIVLYGLALCVVGMAVFNIGLSYGLSALGGQSGTLIPAAFTTVDNVPSSPLYALAIGLSIALLFAWVLGLGATLAEPALNAMGMTVEDLTNGAFRKRLLMYSVAIGVAFGIAVGVAKVVFGLPLFWLLLPSYAVAILLTALSSEEFVNVAWDSAGVTTGPVTVPLVLAMGVGLGDAVQANEGFGILTMASVFPIISVLATGLWVRFASRRGAADLHINPSQMVTEHERA